MLGELDQNGELVKVNAVESEKRRIDDEYNIQRAKMKELFLQKEAECVKIRSEFEKLQNNVSQIRSQLLLAKSSNSNDATSLECDTKDEAVPLQHLVNEMLEEASLHKAEVRKLEDENRELKFIVSKCREEQAVQPAVISDFPNTLPKNLDSEHPLGFNNLDDSMRKAQEDAAVLRSLVIPLEEEIRELKEKLREKDTELQTESRNVGGSSYELAETKLNLPPKNASEDLGLGSIHKRSPTNYSECEMCRNYEAKLVQSQSLLVRTQDKLDQCQVMLYSAREELNKEANLRKDLEECWYKKLEKYKNQVSVYNSEVRKSAKALIDLKHQFLRAKNEISANIVLLTADRQKINTQLRCLQEHNDFLSAKYLSTSEELQNQTIDLPNDVDELHVLLLKLYNDLVLSRVATECEHRKYLSFMDEVYILREKLDSLKDEKVEKEKELHHQINCLKERLRTLTISCEDAKSTKEHEDKLETEANRKYAELRARFVELKSHNDALEQSNNELQGKIKILQGELTTSEQVQKDFVKLSQSLQMNLEKIRRTESEVRWQDDDDVQKCPGCSTTFTVTFRKQHCRHCGTIYCDKCLTKAVPSGPRKKLARVCDVCHTLLFPYSAPYFSQAPP